MFYNEMTRQELYELKAKKLNEINKLQGEVYEIQRAIDDKPSLMDEYMKGGEQMMIREDVKNIYSCKMCKNVFEEKDIMLDTIYNDYICKRCAQQPTLDKLSSIEEVVNENDRKVYYTYKDKIVKIKQIIGDTK